MTAPSPWHIRQSSRPSSVCGITGGPPVVVGSAVGVVGVVGAVGAVGVVGVVGFAGVVAPPQETVNKPSPSISTPTTTYQASFFFTWFYLLLIIAHLS